MAVGEREGERDGERVGWEEGGTARAQAFPQHTHTLLTRVLSQSQARPPPLETNGIHTTNEKVLIRAPL